MPILGEVQHWEFMLSAGAAGDQCHQMRPDRHALKAR